MISVDDARERMLDRLSPCPSRSVPLSDACGRVLAAPMIARSTQPPFPASAMDGYAIRSTDMGPPPSRLRLIGESAAGREFDGFIAPGTAVRISTGAPIPQGADQVVVQERSQMESDCIVLDDTARPMANIRRAGTDFSEGEMLIPAGWRLTPEAIALAAAAQLADLSIVPRPRIGILATGDELAEPGEKLGPSQIVNSISQGLTEMIRNWGGEPVYLGIARDNPDDVRSCLAARSELDLLVTIGGASVGDHDHLRRVFAEEGGRLEFEKIAIKPGKPTWFGVLGETPCLGLPGNPVSAFVLARLLLRSAIGRLEGGPVAVSLQQAVSTAALDANDHRETYLRAWQDGSGRVTPLTNQDSSALSALVRANCLIRRPVDAPAVQQGEIVEVLKFESCE